MQRVAVTCALAAALALAACGGPRLGPTPPPGNDPGGGTGTGNPPPPPPPPPTLSITRILAFGDSMTDGTLSPVRSIFYLLDAGRAESYPFKLQALESERYRDQTITVLNAGFGGRRATQDRQRLNDAVTEAHPEVLLLLEGANDLNNGETVTETVNALEDLVRDAQRAGVTVLIATLPPQRPGQRNTHHADVIPGLNDAIRAMASKKEATLVDLYAQFPIELIGEDGLHPTEEGYQKFAEIFQAAIASKWEQPPQSMR